MSRKNFNSKGTAKLTARRSPRIAFQKSLKTRFLSLFSAIAFMLAILTHSTVLRANDDNIPTLSQNIEGFTVEIPDWDRITWSSLPPIESSGQIAIPQELIYQLGYNPGRTWKIGDTADRIVKLGDVDSLKIEKFALRQIEDLSGIKLASFNLKDFDLASWQTLESITNAIPGLDAIAVSEIKFFKDFIAAAEGGDLFDALTIGDAAQLPGLGNLPFGEVLDLSKYKLDSIPGLIFTPIDSLKDWGNSFISQVPGLNLVPFAKFPLSFGFNLTQVAIADNIFSVQEHGDPEVGKEYFVSGQTKGDKTIPVRCKPNKPCAYVEFSGKLGELDPFFGKRWASGETQQVEGGEKFLKIINGGKEPTGRLVFGEVFKVVVTKTNESLDLASTGLYLRVCIKDLFVDLGCSPYFIGPIPWIPMRQGHLVLMGGSAPSIKNIPRRYRQQISRIISKYRPRGSRQPGQARQQPCQNCQFRPGDGLTTGNTIHPVSRRLRYASAPGTPVTSGYGWRQRPMDETGQMQFHRGIDLAAPIGTPVKAIDGGVVLRTGGNNSCADWGNSFGKRNCGGQLGNWVDIKLNNGKVVRYGHLKSGSVLLKRDDKISQGQKIGEVGSSGWSTGPHLDIRIHDDNGLYENPDKYIRSIY